MPQETAAYTAVSHALWVQRETLQTLLYRLLCEKLVLTSGSSRWLARADDEMRAAAEQLRGGELMRAAEVEELTRILGLDPNASLAEIAAASDEPWATLLDDHRTALRTLAFEVQSAADENRQLLAAGSRAVAETLAEITNVVSRYDATGRVVHADATPIFLDEQA
ncbi:MAG TPA: flagellar export chaperone FlgN [Jatrophihabitans sp.]|nr:flagellar export chaperone FlgN [Jatrophihabitans sp.]